MELVFFISFLWFFFILVFFELRVGYKRVLLVGIDVINFFVDGDVVLRFFLWGILDLIKLILLVCLLYILFGM